MPARPRHMKAPSTKALASVDLPNIDGIVFTFRVGSQYTGSAIYQRNTLFAINGLSTEPRAAPAQLMYFWLHNKVVSSKIMGHR